MGYWVWHLYESGMRGREEGMWKGGEEENVDGSGL